MNDINFKLLQPTSIIESKLPEIIEGFVEFYGEENREHIEEKFKNFLVIGYGNPKNGMGLIRKIKDNKKEEAFKYLFDKLNIPEEERKDLRKKLFDTYGFDVSNLMPIQKYVDYLTIPKDVGNYEFRKDNAYSFLKQFNSKITLDNMDELIASGVLSEIDELVEVYKECISLYKESLEPIKPYIEEAERNEELRDELYKKHLIEFIDEFIHLMPEQEQVLFAKDKKSGYISSYKLPTIDAYFGFSLKSNPLLAAFTLESEEQLKTGHNWKRNSIKDDRIRFFKKLGLDLGNEYESYVNSEECEALWPNQELVESIINSRTSRVERVINEFYTSTEEYKQNKARIEEQGLIIKDDGFDANAYHNGTTFISVNVKEEQGITSTYPIMCINNGMSQEFLDKNIIHELNHIYELNFIEEVNGVYSFICGWDIAKEDTNKEISEIVSIEERKEKRNYELISEIVNEIIAQEIAGILKDKNIFMFNDAENGRTFGGSGYQATFFLIRDFFQNYREEILASRKYGDMQIIFDKVGEENFNALNELFHEFNEYFSGMKIYTYYNDREKQLDTDLTRKHDSLVQRRDEILVRMNEYSNQHKL